MATGLFPKPVGASNMTYLQPELKALQISFSTFFWLCRCDANGKFLIRSDIVNDGWGLLLQLLLLLLLLFSYLHLPFHYLPCIYDCNCILEKNQVFDSFFALLLLEDRLVRASSHITSSTNCIRWSFTLWEKIKRENAVDLRGQYVVSCVISWSKPLDFEQVMSFD